MPTDKRQIYENRLRVCNYIICEYLIVHKISDELEMPKKVNNAE